MNDVLTQEPSARPLAADVEVRQFQFEQGWHDTTQYNFFADDKFFSVRAMEMRTLKHHNAWVYDDGVLELVNSSEPWELNGDAHLDLRAPRFAVRSDDKAGAITVLSEDSKPVLEIAFTTPITTYWGTPATAAVIHQPLIQADITYNGQSYKGVGYCKRGFFTENPHHLSWRFVEGEANNGAYMLWTADASFGRNAEKYDYFKIAYADGKIVAADNLASFQRDNRAFGKIDGSAYEVRIEPLCEWSSDLKSAEMETRIRQRFCKMTVRHDGKEDTGYALSETGMGTTV